MIKSALLRSDITFNSLSVAVVQLSNARTGVISRTRFALSTPVCLLVYFHITQVDATPVYSAQVRLEIQNDPVLSKVYTLAMDGWTYAGNRSLLHATERTFPATSMSDVENQSDNTCETSPAGSTLVARGTFRSGQN